MEFLLLLFSRYFFIDVYCTYCTSFLDVQCILFFSLINIINGHRNKLNVNCRRLYSQCFYHRNSSTLKILLLIKRHTKMATPFSVFNFNYASKDKPHSSSLIIIIIANIISIIHWVRFNRVAYPLYIMFLNQLIYNIKYLIIFYQSTLSLNSTSRNFSL